MWICKCKPRCETLSDCHAPEEVRSMATYKIIRNYFDRERAPRRRTIRSGLTLEEAQEHCKDPETSSRTCTTAEGLRRTRMYGPWFDGYTEE